MPEAFEGLGESFLGGLGGGSWGFEVTGMRDGAAWAESPRNLIAPRKLLEEAALVVACNCSTSPSWFVAWSLAARGSQLIVKTTPSFPHQHICCSLLHSTSSSDKWMRRNGIFSFSPVAS